MKLIVRDGSVRRQLAFLQRLRIVLIQWICGLGKRDFKPSAEPQARFLESKELAVIVAPCGQPEPKPSASRVVFRFDLFEELGVVL